MESTILQVTSVATAHIKKILEQEDLAEQAVRVGIAEKSPTGFQYQLEFCERSERAAERRPARAGWRGVLRGR